MKYGGAMITFEKELKDCFKFMNRLKIVDISNTLGDAKSLITPATTTHSNIEKVSKEKLALRKTMCRFSVGLENVDDLIQDLAQA